MIVNILKSGKYVAFSGMCVVWNLNFVPSLWRRLFGKRSFLVAYREYVIWPRDSSSSVWADNIHAELEQ